jgi:hypothetical protein
MYLLIKDVMPNTRRIPSVDTMQYMKEHPGDNNSGELHITPDPRHLRVKVEMWHCAAFLDEDECFGVLVALHRAAALQFGDGWRAKAKAYIGGDHA